MGNQASTGFTEIARRDNKYDLYINDQPELSATELLHPGVKIGLSNSTHPYPELMVHSTRTQALKEKSYITNRESGRYLHQLSENTIFHPRPQNDKLKQLQSNQSPLTSHHQNPYKIVNIKQSHSLRRNNLLYSPIGNQTFVKKNRYSTANIIEAASRHIYRNKIESNSQPNQVETYDVDISLNDKNINHVTEADDTSKPDLSAQLGFDVNPESLRPVSQTYQKSDEIDEQMGDVLNEIPLKNIRNFSIIAHIDHGKSTLADRLLEMTGALKAKADNKQVLDKLQVEKERGITVKAQTASLFYKYNDENYLLNLIDTPGHVDFSNEVARSLAACQGVILLVDANQGVQAQTVANFYLAFGKDLTVVPVLNKVDLKNANPDMCKEQLLNLFSIDPEDVLMISAKTGLGVDKLLETVIQRVSPPPGDREAPMRALIFDSWYDRYRGAVALVYVRDGVIKVGDEIASAHTKQRYGVKNLGLLRPHEVPVDKLVGGQVGLVVCNMRTVAEAHIGDTLHQAGATSIEPLVGFTPARPMVFAGVYPMEQAEYSDMRSAIEKLALNDPAVSLTPESSPVLGQGWRVGFLGLLHLEVFNQRLEQEYGAEAIMTAPSVPYKVKLKSKKAIAEYRGEEVIISDPSKLPNREDIEAIYEPVVLGTIITPVEYMHRIIPECIERRGFQKALTTIDNNRTMLQFTLPLNEIIVDFHDAIKSQTSGFASFDYEDDGYQISDMVKLDIRVNGNVVDSLSSIVHKSKAEQMGRRQCEKLVKIIPRQMVEVAIQAAVGSKIIARETIKAFRKDVTAKLYGGDRTRKMKLLEKQAEGKKRMKSIANVNIPREAFIDYLKR